MSTGGGTTQRVRIEATALLACTLGAACAGADTPDAGDAFTVRDSASIQIVENVRPAWEEGEAWTVAEEPARVLGAGDGAELFGVWSAVALSDGRTAVANRGGYEVLVYGPAEDPELVLGREGEGPGEFSSLGPIFRLPGDSILAFDMSQLRLTVFGPDGSLARTTPVPADLEGYRFPLPTGTFADGQILAQSGTGSDGEGGRPETFDGTFLVLTGDAGLGSVIGTRPLGMCGGVDDCRIGAFQPYASALPGDSTVFYAFPRSYEIRELAQDGRTLRIIRKAGQGIPLTPESLDRVIARISERSEQTEEAVRDQLDAQRIPDAMPAFERVLVDPSGHLWVREYEAVVPVVPLPGTDSFRWSPTAPWSVFDPSGRWLGTVRIPSDLRILDIAEDFVVGVHKDELDVETIRVLALRRQERQEE